METNKRNYWGELSLKDRAQFYPYFIEQGITSPKDIADIFNGIYDSVYPQDSEIVNQQDIYSQWDNYFDAVNKINREKNRVEGHPGLHTLVDYSPNIPQPTQELPRDYFWRKEREALNDPNRNKLELYGNGGNIYDGETEDSQQVETQNQSWEEGPRGNIVRIPINMDDVYDAANFVKDYYSSSGYTSRLAKVGLPAVPLNMEEVPFYVDPNSNIAESYNNGFEAVVGTAPYYFTFPTYNTIFGKTVLDSDAIELDKNAIGAYPAIAMAHELAHFHPLFNTSYENWNSPLRPYKEASPMYGNNYTKIPPYWKYILTPNKEVNTHDYEMSENYSDLMALRYFLQKNKIFDSLNPKAEFKDSDYKKILDFDGGENLRFINNHSKEAVIKAINDVASSQGVEDNPNIVSYGGNLYGLGSWINKGIGKLRQLVGWKKPIDNNSTSGYEWSDDQITDIAKAFETYQNKPYIGVKGDVLGGYGHKMTKDEIGKYWDSEKQEAKETIPDRIIQGWLKSDMDTAFKSVDTYYGKDIPSNIRAALAALSFQGGDKLIRGKRDDAGNIVDSWGGSPNFERAVKAYIKDNSQDNLNAIFNQMQYKDDNKSNMRGLSSQYGLYRAIVENIADPKKIQEYKDSATFNLYRSNKTK